MVKMEIPGKGRGIVAARNIKMGEEIFRDMPVINLALNEEGELKVNPEIMTSLREQIENLSSEAKSKYFKLRAGAHTNTFHVSRQDFDLLKLFLENNKAIPLENRDCAMLLLNLALVNHSCVPNSELGRIGLCVELRAIKDISKGEEITIFYGLVGDYGDLFRKRKTHMKNKVGFVCKCLMCLRQVPYQKNTLKKLIRLRLQNEIKDIKDVETELTNCNWKKEAFYCNKLVKLYMELKMGGLYEKVLVALAPMAITAHLARDKDLVKKAMNEWKQLAEETKIDYFKRFYDCVEAGFSQWSNEFTSGNAPEKKEIDFLFSRLVDPIIADVD